MLAPGVPYRSGPTAHRRRVLLRRCVGDVGDRDLAAETWDSGLFDVARAREPALDAVVHLFCAFVLDRDGEAGEVRGEGTAGQDVSVVLARIAVNRETAHRRVAGVLECAKTEVVEELLARIAAANQRAALGTGLEVAGRLAKRVREAQEIGDVAVVRDEPVDTSPLGPGDHPVVAITNTFESKAGYGSDSNWDKRQLRERLVRKPVGDP